MSFIKRGDGKITSVLTTEELTDEQKKTAKDLSKKSVKQSSNIDDSSVVKESGE